MDARFINPVIDAFREILPQLGFADIQRGKLSMGSSAVDSLGVTVIIGMTKDLRGSVAYNMSEATAMTIASTAAMIKTMPPEASLLKNRCRCFTFTFILLVNNSIKV